MRKNIKLIPLFLFLFVFQLLYFLSTIYTEILYLIFDYPHKHYTFKYFEV